MEAHSSESWLEKEKDMLAQRKKGKKGRSSTMAFASTFTGAASSLGCKEPIGSPQGSTDLRSVRKLFV